jgi:hypothetical protein
MADTRKSLLLAVKKSNKRMCVAVEVSNIVPVSHSMNGHCYPDSLGLPYPKLTLNLTILHLYLLEVGTSQGPRLAQTLWESLLTALFD